MFVAGLALFAASSLLCGFAWSAGSLVGFRALQGLGGALLAPAALSLLMTTFAEGRERNRALGIYGAASGSGAAAGVLLGGVITSYLGWSWIFFVNVPVGRRRDRAHAVPAARQPRGAAAPPLRPGRRRLGHERADAARLRTDPGGDRRLELARHARAARRRGGAHRGVRRDRVALSLAAPAAADLPPACAVGRERDDGARRSRDVLGVLRPHALRAGRPPLLGRAERCRVRRLRPVGRRRLEPRAGGGRRGSASGDAHDGARARHDLGRPAHAGAGGRPLLLGSVPGLRARRNGARLLVRARHDREPRRVWTAPTPVSLPGS